MSSLSWERLLRIIRIRLPDKGRLVLFHFAIRFSRLSTSRSTRNKSLGSAYRLMGLRESGVPPVPLRKSSLRIDSKKTKVRLV